MCGKDVAQDSPTCNIVGSPPHVRERQNTRSFNGTAYGITPACAGKTFFESIFPNFMEYHPRMCGKDLKQMGKNVEMSGSPPHVRERHMVSHIQSINAGITPACAGKTPKM